MPRERVDDAVEGLVRKRFALVATPLEHDRAPLGRAKPLDERRDERALAETGFTLHANGHRASVGARIGERLPQKAELFAPPDERAARGHVGSRVGRGEPEATRDFGAGRAAARVAPQELFAEAIEIGGDVGCARAGRGTVARVLALDEIEQHASEREHAGQRLVEHDADAVPVRLGSHRIAAGLLGRHVDRGADDRRRHLLLVGLRDESEVEQHHAAARGHEDVGRLDVAVHEVGGVKRQKAARELTQRCPHARLVVPVGPEPVAVAHVLDEALPRQKLHREEPLAVVVEQLAEAHEVAMRDVGERAKLVLEALDSVAVGRAQRLQGYFRFPLAIEHLVDDAHPAGAEHALDLEARRPLEVGSGLGRVARTRLRARLVGPRVDFSA
jgi:hypothetical protein